MTSSQVKRTITKSNLLHLIRYCSRITACQATNVYFADKLGVSRFTVNSLLQELQQDGKILLATAQSYNAQNGFWHRNRTIFLVSPLNTQDGGLLFANIIRSRGRVVDVEKVGDRYLCGIIQCTMEQLDTYRYDSFKAGWIRFGNQIRLYDGTIGKGYQRVGKFPLSDPPPGRQWVERDGHMMMSDYLNEFVKQEHTTDKAHIKNIILELVGQSKLNNAKLTKSLQNHPNVMGRPCGRLWVELLVRELIKEGKLYRLGNSRAKFLSLTSIVLEPTVVSAVECPVNVINQLFQEKVNNNNVLRKVSLPKLHKVLKSWNKLASLGNDPGRAVLVVDEMYQKQTKVYQTRKQYLVQLMATQ